MIVQSHPAAAGEAHAQLHRAAESALAKSVEAAKTLAQSLGCRTVTIQPEHRQALGQRRRPADAHGRGHPHVQALAEAGINLEMINTSEVRVNVVVDGTAGPATAREQTAAAFADVLR